MNLPDQIDTEIDDELTEKIEKIINETNLFNTSNVEMVNLYFFYCINDTLEQYTKIVVPLKNNTISKDELFTNIVKYRISDGRRFNLNGIYSYQFNSDIIKFLKDNECSVKEHKKIQDIQFEPMVDLFQHYTSFFIILNNEKTKHTKKMSDIQSKRKTMKN
jgi:hypothetical protein